MGVIVDCVQRFAEWTTFSFKDIDKNNWCHLVKRKERKDVDY